jgi:hypothetical protein
MRIFTACILVLTAAVQVGAQTYHYGSSVSGNRYNYSRSSVDIRLSTPTYGGYSGQMGNVPSGPLPQTYYRPGPRGPIYYYPQWEGDSLSVGDSSVNMGTLRMIPVRPANPYYRR